jgi:hypothetical protein
MRTKLEQGLADQHNTERGETTKECVEHLWFFPLLKKEEEEEEKIRKCYSLDFEFF